MAIKGLKDQLKNRTVEIYDERDNGGAKGEHYLKLKDEMSIYKPKEGRNAVDIIPFCHTTDVFKGKKVGDPNYMLDVFVHKNFNQSRDRVVCQRMTFNKPCPICERRYMLMDLNKNDNDKDAIEERDKLIAAMKPQRRVLMDVINLKEDEEDEHNGEIQILDESHFLFAKELIEEAVEASGGDEPIDFYTPDEGQSVFFRGTPTPIGKGKATYLKYKSFTFAERDEPYDDSVIDDAFSLDSVLNIHTYDEISAMLNESAPVATETADSEDDEESTPKKARTSKYKKVAKEEPIEEDEEEYEEEDEPANEPTEETASNQCPNGLKYGVDGDPANAECQKCMAENKKLAKQCIVQSLV
jgi:hypothetical protein